MGKANTGCIIKLPNGNYKAIIEYPPVAGKRVKKTKTVRTPNLAKRALKDLILERDRVLRVNPNGTPSLLFKDALKVYKDKMDDKVRMGTLKLRTRIGYDFILELLNEHFMFYDLYKVTADELDVFFKGLLINKKYVMSTVAKTKILLNGIFKANKVPTKALMESEVVLYTHHNNKHKVYPLTTRELEALNRYFKDTHSDNRDFRMKYLYYATLFTGCRMGEITGLKWSSLREEDGIIIIDSALAFIPHRGLIEETPKSYESDRRLIVPKSFFKVIKELEVAYKDNGYIKGSQYIFHTKNGTPLSPRNVLRSWVSSQRKAGLVHKHTFHDIRHTNITIKIARGIDVKTVSIMAGHSDTAITLDTYSHYWKEAAQKAANIFDTYK